MGTLVTGFPTNFLARRLVRELIQTRDTPLWLLVLEQHQEAAAKLVALWNVPNRAPVTLVVGDCTAIDMGLSGAEWSSLRNQVSVIHHCAHLVYPRVPRKDALRVHVQGTEEVCIFGQAATNLSRVVLWSTASVSGKRSGYVLESDRTSSHGFFHHLEETRLMAEEVLIRAALPSVLLRPTTIIGDSETFEVHRYTGFFGLVRWLVRSPKDIRIPMSYNKRNHFHAVPADYVAKAGLLISEHPEAVGRCFHLSDPNPPTIKDAVMWIAEAAGRPVPANAIPNWLAHSVFRTPWVGDASQALRELVERASVDVVYDERNTREILGRNAPACPTLKSYLPRLVASVSKEVLPSDLVEENDAVH